MEITLSGDINDASFSLGRAVEEALLLEDHLRNELQQCSRCITKHALRMIAYARESLSLAGRTPDLDAVANFLIWIGGQLDATDSSSWPVVATALAELRRTLILRR